MAENKRERKEVKPRSGGADEKPKKPAKPVKEGDK